jgi:hypothetical protein
VVVEVQPILLEVIAIDVTDKTLLPIVLLNGHIRLPKLTKRIDDNSADDGRHDQVDDDKVEDVENHPSYRYIVLLPERVNG